jgi:CRISPR-associated protein Csm2
MSPIDMELALGKAGYKSPSDSSSDNRPQQNYQRENKGQNYQHQNRDKSQQRKIQPIYNDDYVKRAELVMRQLGNVTADSDRFNFTLTTSKMRGIMTLINQIYNKAVQGDEKLSDDLIAQIKYLKVRIVYEAGREGTSKEKPIKDLLTASCLLEELDRVKASKQKFINFSRYFEALVAYHRFFGGKEN